MHAVLFVAWGELRLSWLEGLPVSLVSPMLPFIEAAFHTSSHKSARLKHALSTHLG